MAAGSSSPTPPEVFRAYQATRGKFREFLLVLMVTGMRPKEIRTVLVDEFSVELRQLVLWHHEVVEKTDLPKVVPLPTEKLLAICRANAEGRSGDEPLFMTDRRRPWSYQAIRLRWKRHREKLGIASMSVSRSIASAIGTSPWPSNRARMGRSSLRIALSFYG